MTCHRVRKEEDRNLTRRRPLGRFVAVIVPLVWFLVLLLLLLLLLLAVCVRLIIHSPGAAVRIVDALERT